MSRETDCRCDRCFCWHQMKLREANVHEGRGLMLGGDWRQNMIDGAKYELTRKDFQRNMDRMEDM